MNNFTLVNLAILVSTKWLNELGVLEYPKINTWNFLPFKTVLRLMLITKLSEREDYRSIQLKKTSLSAYNVCYPLRIHIKDTVFS